MIGSFFVPGAFLVSELRADFDADEVSAQNAVEGQETPILLIHAKDDAFTAATHSESIYANSNQTTTTLHITDWGAGHAESIAVDYDSYELLVDDFLAEHVPTFGLTSDS